MENALILAKQLDFDVFNALDIMENTQFLKVKEKKKKYIFISILFYYFFFFK
jgi:hypothetical protein